MGGVRQGCAPHPAQGISSLENPIITPIPWAQRKQQCSLYWWKKNCQSSFFLQTKTGGRHGRTPGGSFLTGYTISQFFVYGCSPLSTSVHSLKKGNARGVAKGISFLWNPIHIIKKPPKLQWFKHQQLRRFFVFFEHIPKKSYPPLRP